MLGGTGAEVVVVLAVGASAIANNWEMRDLIFFLLFVLCSCLKEPRAVSP